MTFYNLPGGAAYVAMDIGAAGTSWQYELNGGSMGTVRVPR